MLTKYIEAAMRLARYELVEDGTFWAEIPGFRGLSGSAQALEECRDDLRGALEVWLVLKLWDNDEDIPVLGKLSLRPRLARTSGLNATTDAARNRKAS
jgi:predicted RNase H-like HicB family nuclease